MKKNRFTRKLEEIGLLIQNYRHIRKYTLQMLSKLTGISGRYLHSVENGRANVTVLVLYKIFRALEIPESELGCVLASW